MNVFVLGRVALGADTKGNDMLTWMGIHWFGLTVSWALAYAFVLNYYHRNIQEKGPMKPLVAIIIAFICIFWPWVVGGILIASFVRARKGSDET